jgi:hypothetical protein
MLEIKELLWTQEAGAELISWFLVCFSAIYLANHLLNRWQLTLMKAHYPIQGDTLALTERVRVLESRQEGFMPKVSLIERLESLEGKVRDLEGPPKPFSFQFETSLFGRQGMTTTTTPYSLEQQTDPGPSQQYPNLKRVRRSKVRERCCELYGKNWFNHFNKEKRMPQPKEFPKNKTS